MGRSSQNPVLGEVVLLLNRVKEVNYVLGPCASLSCSPLLDNKLPNLESYRWVFNKWIRYLKMPVTFPVYFNSK